MQLKTVQWNIGGGYVRSPESDIDGPYTTPNVDHIISKISAYKPDIVTLQETHQGNHIDQVELIASALGLSFTLHNHYANSHVEPEQKLGQAILSRFTIKERSPTFDLFLNPNLEIVRPDNIKWSSHNKGLSQCTININESLELQIATLSLVPFAVFQTDPYAATLARLRSNIEEKLTFPHKNILVMGDFNIDNPSLKKFIPKTISSNLSEVILEEPTTPWGRYHDHILYKGLQHQTSVVDQNVLTDHFPIISEFTVTK